MDDERGDGETVPPSEYAEEVAPPPPPEVATTRMSIASHKSRKQIDKTDWPFQITIEIAEVTKPKVAFGSGEERKYYPENPGHSKLAQVFVTNSLKGDSPVCTYVGPPIGVNKPISPLGYGIGGLLATRFKKANKSEKRPDPGTYQVVTVPPYPPPPEPCNTVLPQCYRPFVDLPRFPRDASEKTPGPGTYSTGSSVCTKMKSQGDFGSKNCITPTTITVCTYTAGESCTVCGKEQGNDYYRTKRKVKHPESRVPDRPEMVILCRKCYCRAWNGHHPYWNKKNLMYLFQKSRHCSYFHEHHNLPLSIMKTRDKEIKKLTAKEAILAKFFSDHCPPVFKK